MVTGGIDACIVDDFYFYSEQLIRYRSPVAVDPEGDSITSLTVSGLGTGFSYVWNGDDSFTIILDTTVATFPHDGVYPLQVTVDDGIGGTPTPIDFQLNYTVINFHPSFSEYLPAVCIDETVDLNIDNTGMTTVYTSPQD